MKPVLQSAAAIVLGGLALSAGAQTISLNLKPPPDVKKQAHGAQAKSSAQPAPAPAAKALLPEVFDGWVASAPLTNLASADQADAANAAALKEYGFADGLAGTYKRGDETLTVRALGFGDLSGAYGAYSFYRQNGWPKVDIGTGAASDKNRVIFWKGTTVVEANFSHISAMSAGEMRDLAARIPMPLGNRALAPAILASLPQGSLQKQTTHYALGAAGYTGGGGVLPAELVGFDKGAEETVTANYDLTSGPATLTLINYPTPQIAAAQEAKISAYLKAGNKAQPRWPAPLQASDQASLQVRRAGPS